MNNSLKGKVVFIFKDSDKPISIARVICEYEGDEDLSYHGSPWYEKFINAEDLATGVVSSYGNQTYHWSDAIESYCRVRDTLNKIKNMC